MSEPLYLDTHAVIWLHGKIVAKFSKKGKQAIEECDYTYLADCPFGARVPL